MPEPLGGGGAMGRGVRIAIGVGVLLAVAVYFIVAWRQSFFGLPDFDYASNPGMYMLGFHPQQSASIVWKILLILPASVGLAFFLSGVGTEWRFTGWLARPVLPWILALVALVVLVVSIRWLFHETEVTDDEETYLFQARTLLAGRLTNPPPPVPRSFENVFIINRDGQFLGKYTLGHPLVIAAGIVLGHPYAVTVLLSVLLLPLIYGICRQLFEDRRVATLSVLLLSVSPFFYFVSSSRLSHTTTAFCLTLFMYLYLRFSKEAQPPWRAVLVSFVAGIAAGLAANIRPLTGLGFLAPFLVLVVVRLFRSPKHDVPWIAGMSTGFMVMVLFTLWYNKAITGSFTLFPFTYYLPEENVGFGVADHTVGHAFSNLWVSLVRVNSFLFGFPLSLLFVIILPFLGERGFGVRLCYAIVGSFCVAYLFYFSTGVSDLGPIYYYELIVPLTILSACGVMRLHDVLKARMRGFPFLVPNFLVSSVLLAVLVFYPERIVHIKRLTDAVREPYVAVGEMHLHHALVFMHSKPQAGWVLGFRNNSPLFNDEVILCRLLDKASNAGVARYFADRNFYLMMYDPVAMQTHVYKLRREGLADGG